MKRAFAIGAAWTAGASWLEQGAGALIFLVIARLVGVEEFGVAAMAFAFLFLGEFLVRDTITEAIITRPDIEPGRLEATFFALVGFSLVVVAALFAIAPLAARAYGEPAVVGLLMAASPTVLLIAGAGVSTALLRRRLAYRTLALRSVTGVLVGGAVGVAMAANGFGTWSLVGQRLADIGLNSVISVRAAGWRPRAWPSRADFALLAGLGPRVVLLRTISLVIAQTPTVALGALAGPYAAGLYAFGWRLVELTSFLIVKPLQGVAQTVIAEMRRRHASTAAFYLNLTEIAAMGAFAAFAGLALIAAPLVDILVGARWGQVGAILPALCALGAILSLTAMQEAYLLALDRLPAFALAALAEAAIGVVLIFLAAPHGAGLVCAAAALRALLALPLRTAAALAPESIAAADFARALAKPLLVAGGMALAVAACVFAAQDRLSNLALASVAIGVGIATFALLLIRLTPDAASRLRAFLSEDPAHRTNDDASSR
jgi:PST family polysaccharide transporter